LVVEQRERIEDLARVGARTETATSLLKIYEESQKSFAEDCSRLEELLASGRCDN
jgi:hypothetical protein